MPKTYTVGSTDYEFPDSFSDAQVKQILAKKGVIKAPGPSHEDLNRAKFMDPLAAQGFIKSKMGEGVHVPIMSEGGRTLAQGAMNKDPAKIGEGTLQMTSPLMIATGLGSLGVSLHSAYTTGKIAPFLLKAAVSIGAGTLTDREVTQLTGSPLMGTIAGTLAGFGTHFGEGKLAEWAKGIPSGKGIAGLVQYLGETMSPASEAVKEAIKANPEALYKEVFGKTPTTQQELFQAKGLAQRLTSDAKKVGIPAPPKAPIVVPETSGPTANRPGTDNSFGGVPQLRSTSPEPINKVSLPEGVNAPVEQLGPEHFQQAPGTPTENRPESNLAPTPGQYNSPANGPNNYANPGLNGTIGEPVPMVSPEDMDERLQQIRDVESAQAAVKAGVKPGKGFQTKIKTPVSEVPTLERSQPINPAPQEGPNPSPVPTIASPEGGDGPKTAYGRAVGSRVEGNQGVKNANFAKYHHSKGFTPTHVRAMTPEDLEMVRGEVNRTLGTNHKPVAVRNHETAREQIAKLLEEGTTPGPIESTTQTGSVTPLSAVPTKEGTLPRPKKVTTPVPVASTPRPTGPIPEDLPETAAFNEAAGIPKGTRVSYHGPQTKGLTPTGLHVVGTQNGGIQAVSEADLRTLFGR